MANVGFPQEVQNTDEGAPLLGLYLDRPPWKVDPKGFSACNNVRIEQGLVRADRLGWELRLTLPEPIVHIGAFDTSAAYGGVTGGLQIVATTRNLYQINDPTTPLYLTPAYQEGVASVTNGSKNVVGINTRWHSDIQCGGTYDQFSPDQTYQAGQQGVTTNLTAAYNWATPQVPIVCLTNPAVLDAGTTLRRFNPANPTQSIKVVFSTLLTAQVTSADVFQIGSGITLRQAVKPGDQVYFGAKGQQSLTARWYTVATVTDDTHFTLTENYENVTATVYYTVRQLFTDTTQGPNPYLPHCSSVTFPNAGGEWSGDNWFFTNGVDPVVQLYNSGYIGFPAINGVGPLSFYARSIPFSCKTLCHAHSTLVCGGLSLQTNSALVDGLQMANSDNGLPTSFASGVAFQGDVADGAFNIVRMSTLGDILLIYANGLWQGSQDGLSEAQGIVVSAQFVGAPTVWNFATVLQNRGPLAGGLVLEFPDRHQFLALDGEYRYNGLFTQIMNDQVWREVLKTYDASRAQMAQAIVIPTYGDAIWAIPQLSDPADQYGATTAWVEHYMEQANSYLFKPMTQRDFPFTAIGCAQISTSVTFDEKTLAFNEYSTTFDANGVLREMPPTYLAGDQEGNIWTLYVSNTQAGVPALCTATFGSRVIGNARARALVTRVYPSFEVGSGTANVTITLRDALAGPVKITDTQPFDLTYSGNRFTTHYRRGRVVSVTLSDTAGVGWACAGYDDDWLGGGLR